MVSKGAELPGSSQASSEDGSGSGSAAPTALTALPQPYGI